MATNTPFLDNTKSATASAERIGRIVAEVLDDAKAGISYVDVDSYLKGLPEDEREDARSAIVGAKFLALLARSPDGESASDDADRCEE